eukprot:scaffold89428_cov63-Phaeocystis_antarctica.AAC.4
MRDTGESSIPRLTCSRVNPLIFINAPEGCRQGANDTQTHTSPRKRKHTHSDPYHRIITTQGTLNDCFCGLSAAPVRVIGELRFHHRRIAQRRTPIEVPSRNLELRCRARPRLPSTSQIVTFSTQHESPHEVGWLIVRRRPHNPRRQRLELLVVPPLRLDHLGARLLLQHVEGICRGLCPLLRAHRTALFGLEEPLRGLHVVPRVVEHYTEVDVRRGLVGPQGDGLAVGLACFAPVLLRGVPRALSQQLTPLVAHQRGVPGQLLRDLASSLLRLPTILAHLPLLPQLLVKRPVQLPSARVGRAVLAALVRSRQLLVEAHIADGMLLTPVVHV